MPHLYRFDPRDFTFRRVRRGLWFYLVRGLPYALVVLLVAAAAVTLFYVFYDSPRTQRLKAQQAQLQAALTDYSTLADTLENTVAQLERRERELYKFILDADPDSAAIDTARLARLNVANVQAADLDDISDRLGRMTRRLDLQNEQSARMVEIARQKREQLAFIPSIRPIPSEVLSGFGTRKHPVFKEDRVHAGMDFKADLGSKVYATADGLVQFAGNVSSNGRGISVHIDHLNGYVTRYAHLQRVAVRAGQRVKRGDVIGYSGNSGLTKGPHLYYEVLKGGQPLDPIDFFFNDLTPTELIEFRRKAAQYNESMG